MFFVVGKQLWKKSVKLLRKLSRRWANAEVVTISLENYRANSFEPVEEDNLKKSWCKKKMYSERSTTKSSYLL